MAPQDVLEVSLTIIASLGGGGAIVFGLSNYLGRVWADRGLAQQRQKYDQLNIELTSRLDIATRRIQVELDALGHLHKLRTQAEFDILQNLWKRIAVLRRAFHRLPSRIVLGPSDKRAELNANSSKEFIDCMLEMQEVLYEQTLSIPKHIADEATELLKIAHEEGMQAMYYPNPDDNVMFNNTQREELFDKRSMHLAQYDAAAKNLEMSMREFLRGSDGGADNSNA